MKVNKFFGKRSIIFSFLISYLCVFIVPILSNIFIYKKSLKVVEQEINQANTDMLHQVQQTLDSRLVDVNNLLLLISLDNRILSLMYAKDQLNAVNKYILPQMIDDLHSYTVTNSFIKNLYVFFKNTDLIITPNVSFDTQYAYKHFNYSSISYQEWYDIMTEKSHNKVIVFSKDHNKQSNKSIAFVQSIPMQYKKDPLASVVIELDTAVF
ncbi:MAG: hypothetical protein GX962_05965 [Epulopiscium sp.]|nr:hypothetical protein [Candidatus Epulonipiscium sp.]